MKKTVLAAAILAIAAVTPAKAEVIDVSTIKCSELATMSKEEASYLLVWIHGYTGGKAEDTTIDLTAFEKNGAAVGEKCAANPELGLMTAIQQVGE